MQDVKNVHEVLVYSQADESYVVAEDVTFFYDLKQMILGKIAWTGEQYYALAVLKDGKQYPLPLVYATEGERDRQAKERDMIAPAEEEIRAIKRNVTKKLGSPFNFGKIRKVSEGVNTEFMWDLLNAEGYNYHDTDERLNDLIIANGINKLLEVVEKNGYYIFFDTVEYRMPKREELEALENGESFISFVVGNAAQLANEYEADVGASDFELVNKFIKALRDDLADKQESFRIQTQQHAE